MQPLRGTKYFQRMLRQTRLAPVMYPPGAVQLGLGMPKKVLISPQVVVSIPVMVWLVGLLRSCWSAAAAVLLVREGMSLRLNGETLTVRT